MLVVAEPGAPDGGAAIARRAATRLHELEQRWSRFRSTSEISGLNAAAGEPRTVHPDTIRLVRALVEAWHATGGAFDPTLLGALVELGYAASRDDETLRTSLAADAWPRGRPDRVLVDADANVVRLPVGTTLDPGGMGKGLAADIVVDEALDEGALGALVEIGGDVRVAGTPPDGAWTISIAALGSDPHRRSIRMNDGGVATSTSRLRTWQGNGQRHHHLIDPDALRSTSNDVVSCTVIAGSAAWAEGFTKVPFVLGAADALERFEERSLAASITTADGAHRTSSTWTDFAS